MGAFALGTFFYVQANNNRELLNTEVDSLVKPMEKPVLVEEVYWFELNETISSSPSDQTFKTGAPMPSDPPTTGNTECAQSGNAGDYCGVALRFTGSGANPIDTDLSGYTNLQDVLDNHPNAVIIVTDDPSVDSDQDGYSQKPL